MGNLAQAGNVGRLIIEVFKRRSENGEIKVAFLGYTEKISPFQSKKNIGR